MRLNEYKRNLNKEYKDTFKKKRKFIYYLKPKYIWRAIILVLACIMVVDHVGVAIYNSNIDSKIEKHINSADYVKIDNAKQYNKINSNYGYTKKKSFLTKVFSIQLIGCGANGTAPEQGSSSAYNTNVQVEGIDESDVSKCDGKYIYALLDEKLCIYNLNGDLVSSIYSSANEIYVYEDNVIGLGDYSCYIYKFYENSIGNIYCFEYDRYVDSRLRDGHLYLVYSQYAKENRIDYGNCYYDNNCYPQYVFSVVDYDLETGTMNKVQALSGYELVLYMSYDNFYLATSQSLDDTIITSVLMFDKALNPVGVMKTNGRVLNQFSMDEYNGYFRIVTTDTNQDAERLNALSIFDLSSLERVGFFNEGIGIGRQTVKSVTYSENRCYVVTYETTDPLYEIDCSDYNNIYIVSKLEAPGYSNYLYKFVINNQEYILGLGYIDNLRDTKISIYLNDESGTPQIGEDFIIGSSNYYNQVDYLTEKFNEEMFTNHKALFLYNDGYYLYLGALVGIDEYIIFKIDIHDEDNLVDVYKKFDNKTGYNMRSYLIDDILYVVTSEGILKEAW